MATIYIPLLNEAVECWRPVEAINVGSGLYRIASDFEVPEDEEWAFQPGEVVRCVPRRFAEGEGLEAVASAEAAP